MSAFEWEKVWHYSEDDLPPLGAFIQLKIGHVDGNDTRIVEGTVVRVQTSTTTSIGIAPEPVEDASGEWGWEEWRARVVPLGQEEMEEDFIPGLLPA